jgi:hypothetical protein
MNNKKWWENLLEIKSLVTLIILFLYVALSIIGVVFELKDTDIFKQVFDKANQALLIILGFFFGVKMQQYSTNKKNETVEKTNEPEQTITEKKD